MMKIQSHVFATTMIVLGLIVSSCGSPESNEDANVVEEEAPATEMERPAPAADQHTGHQIQIVIGEQGTVATSPDLEVEALRAGRTAYTIETGAGVYRVELTQAQVAELLGGSTIVVEGSSEATGTESVRISMTGMDH
jgi:hypothetical protein